MSERGAGKKAGMPEQSREASGGTAQRPGPARQADAVCEEHVGGRCRATLEEVLCRDNMPKAHQRVMRNRGAPATGPVDSSEAACHAVAAMEATTDPGTRADSQRAGSATSLALREQWPGSVA